MNRTEENVRTEKSKSVLLVITGVLSVVYLVTELFLYPYLVRLQSTRYVPYIYYYYNSIRVIGIFVVMLFLLLLLQRKNILILRYKNKALLFSGLGMYMIYYLLLILNLVTGFEFAFSGIIFQIAVVHSWILCIPAMLLALGLAGEPRENG